MLVKNRAFFQGGGVFGSPFFLSPQAVRRPSTMLGVPSGGSACLIVRSSRAVSNSKTWRRPLQGLWGHDTSSLGKNGGIDMDWTKTDSETTPDSETRDSETARRIQKINVVFRNYFVGFRNYFVGFRNYSWYSETISWYSKTISWYSETIRSIQKLFRGIQKLFRGIQKLLVVFRNYS